MEKLTKEEVLHVADLGKLKLSDEEIDRFSYQLKSLFNEIDKVNEIDINTEEGLISPSERECDKFLDEYKINNEAENLIKNAPNKFENFIEVAGVFDE